jgi:hypothetical protein
MLIVLSSNCISLVIHFDHFIDRSSAHRTCAQLTGLAHAQMSARQHQSIDLGKSTHTTHTAPEFAASCICCIASLWRRARSSCNVEGACRFKVRGSYRGHQAIPLLVEQPAVPFPKSFPLRTYRLRSSPLQHGEQTLRMH